MAVLLAACSTSIYMPGGLFSQAQLISGLQAHGYRDVTLSDRIASPSSPAPELAMPVRSADDPEAQKTSVHVGSNGTAVKDGQLVYIYIRSESPASLPPDTGAVRDGQRLNIYLDRVAQLTVEERRAGAYLEKRLVAAPPPAASAAAETKPAPPRGAPGAETISSDIALRLAEMVFAHNYGREVTDAQLPLSIADGGDRWEIRGRTAASSPPDAGRLGITIMKADARIVEMVK
jgi:hypothetical protein